MPGGPACIPVLGLWHICRDQAQGCWPRRRWTWNRPGPSGQFSSWVCVEEQYLIGGDRASPNLHLVWGLLWSHSHLHLTTPLKYPGGCQSSGVSSPKSKDIPGVTDLVASYKVAQ